MGDHFRKLPREILLMILKVIPSLPCLRNLISASKEAAEIFEEYGSEIVESVLSFIPEELQWNIRAVTMILYDFNQYQHQYIMLRMRDPKSHDSAKQTNPKGVLFEGPLLPRNLPTSHLKKILKFACHIYQVAATYLATNIKEFNSLQPMHLKNPNIDFTAEEVPLKHPEFWPYTPTTMDHHSWVEEYRVVRATWLLLLAHVGLRKFTDVKAKNFRKYGFYIVLSHLVPWWQTDTIEGVEDWMEKMNLSIYPHVKNQLPISSHEADARSVLENPPTDKASKAWQQDFHASQDGTLAYGYFRYTHAASHLSTLTNFNWASCRNLGFSIWDSKRLTMMGLITMPEEVPESDENWIGEPLTSATIAFAWESVLKP